MKKNKLKFISLVIACILSGCPVLLADDSTIGSDGKDMFRLKYLGLEESSEYLFTDELKKVIENGVSYWADILAPRSKNPSPFEILVQTKCLYPNAAANFGAFTFNSGEVYPEPSSIVQDFFKNGCDLNSIFEPELHDGLYCYGAICVGQYVGADSDNSIYGWNLKPLNSTLPKCEQSSALSSVLVHEMAHVLGVVCDMSEDSKVITKTGAYGVKTQINLKKMNENCSEYSTHLYDQNGNQAKAGMPIVTTDYLEDLRKANVDFDVKDFFCVDIPAIMNDEQKTKAKEYGATDNTIGKLYFRGENLSQVLNGKTFDGIDGIPVKGWEKTSADGMNEIYAPDFSHLELKHGLMSHQTYRNYTGFMEAELAVMQDIGYEIDRRQYFGYSVYNDGVTLENTFGYSARNEAGTGYVEGKYNSTPLGIGLHIYGSDNNITQAADILTIGTGAAGVRIDGIKDEFSVKKGVSVRSDGNNGIGLLCAFGNSHKINIDGTVTADGAGGNAVQLDFGSNILGLAEYLGSHIEFMKAVGPDGTVMFSFNWFTFLYPEALEELTKEMVSQLNLSGTVSGENNAIYVGKNAFVKEININSGAIVSGDITSEWKHFEPFKDAYKAAPNDLFDFLPSEPLLIKYKEDYFDYDKYIPEYVTALNINGNFDYKDNINGSDNIKLNINNGIFNFYGSADVNSVQVKKDASLFGGNFKLNNMNNKLAEGLDSDENSGKFINKGTIGAQTPVDSDTALNIEGVLINEGSLQFTANNDYIGKINVTGSIEDRDSKLTIDPDGIYTPGKTYSLEFVFENGNTKDINWKEQEQYRQGMLYSKYDAGGVTFALDNPLGESGDQNTDNAFNALVAFGSSSNENTRSVAQAVYRLDGPRASRALRDIGGGENSLAVSMNMRHNSAALSLSKHLDSQFGRFSFDASQKENDEYGWVDLGRNRNNFGRGLGKLNGSSVTAGIDKNLDGKWRYGFYAGYENDRYSSDSATDKNKNTRLGLFRAFSNEVNRGHIYVEYGFGRNDNDRSIRDLGLKADSSYRHHSFEIGGEYKHIHNYGNGKDYHFAPYVNASFARYSQKKYSETGAGIFNQQVKAFEDTLITFEGGMEFQRETKKGSYTARIGYKNIVSSANPSLSFAYEGNPDVFYKNRTKIDRDFITASFNLEYRLKRNLSLSADFSLEKGEHDSFCSANIWLTTSL